mmetsp:Transcript_23/g.43  ORF Transcript_23/g.43 Transcript_23/m.43 type:complete len:286 (-) Transcript_23:57-914(-)
MSERQPTGPRLTIRLLLTRLRPTRQRPGLRNRLPLIRLRPTKQRPSQTNRLLLTRPRPTRQLAVRNRCRSRKKLLPVPPRKKRRQRLPLLPLRCLNSRRLRCQISRPPRCLNSRPQRCPSFQCPRSTSQICQRLILPRSTPPSLTCQSSRHPSLTLPSFPCQRSIRPSLTLPSSRHPSFRHPVCRHTICQILPQSRHQAFQPFLLLALVVEHQQSIQIWNPKKSETNVPGILVWYSWMLTRKRRLSKHKLKQYETLPTTRRRLLLVLRTMLARHIGEERSGVFVH